VDVFVLVFAAVFIAGFVIRGAYRAGFTEKCPNCRERVDKTALVCKHCGRDLPATA
jgi:predicted amidophosphoribosyltransferase